MAKKIYDIVSRDAMGGDSEMQQPKPVVRKRKKPFFFLSLIFIIIAIIAAGSYFLFPGRAEVEISPKIDELAAEAQITVDSNESILNYDNNVIPGIIFNGDNNKVYSEDYESTGSSDNVAKATGTIRVYNKMSPAKPVSLIRNTGFLSYPGGLIYRADSAFTIPAAKADGTPGSIDIKVTASEAGTKYNIKSATFSVPKLSGTEYYINISAETIPDKPISGGEESVVKIVSKDDLTLSKDAFQKKYTEEAKQALIQSIPQGYDYFPDDIIPQVNNLTVDAVQGDRVDKFNISAKVTSTVLVFRRDDINKLGEALLQEKMPEAKTLVPGSISYEVTSRNLKSGKLSLTVTFKSNIYSAPDTDFILTTIKGKDKDYSLSILKNIPELENVNIKLFPFWQINIPGDEKMIDIKVNLNK